MAYQLTPFEIGQVKAHMEHGLSAASIAQRVFKKDGKSTFGPTAIQNCMSKLKEKPKWRGERPKGSGRPRKTNKKQDKEIVKWLLKERGKQKVTVL
jgi:transposase